jgi:hypothetical protein
VWPVLASCHSVDGSEPVSECSDSESDEEAMRRLRTGCLAAAARWKPREPSPSLVVFWSSSDPNASAWLGAGRRATLAGERDCRSGLRRTCVREDAGDTGTGGGGSLSPAADSRREEELSACWELVGCARSDTPELEYAPLPYHSCYFFSRSHFTRSWWGVRVQAIAPFRGAASSALVSLTICCRGGVSDSSERSACGDTVRGGEGSGRHSERW